MLKPYVVILYASYAFLVAVYEVYVLEGQESIKPLSDGWLATVLSSLHSPILLRFSTILLHPSQHPSERQSLCAHLKELHH